MFRKKDPEKLPLEMEGRNKYNTEGSVPDHKASRIDNTGGIKHCHDNSQSQEDRQQEKTVAKNKLCVICVISLLFRIGEIVGGYYAGSLALMTDVDFICFLIILVSLWLSSRPATHKLSYGWHRAEILGALMMVFIIWLITGVMAYLAVERLTTDDYTIDPTIMLITSGCGIFVNFIMGVILYQSGHGPCHGGPSSNRHGRSDGSPSSNGHGRSHAGPSSNGHGQSHGGPSSNGHGRSHAGPSSNGHGQSNRGLSSNEHGHSHKEGNGYNHSSNHAHSNDDNVDLEQKGVDHGQKAQQVNASVRAAFVHVVGDLLQNISVFISAIIIYFEPEYKNADPICTLLFSIFIMFTTLPIMRDILTVLMGGTPAGMKHGEVRDHLLAVKGVKAVHNLHIWALTTNLAVLSAHVAIDKSMDAQTVLRELTQSCFSTYNFHSVTIQIEREADLKPGCTLCEDPKM